MRLASSTLLITGGYGFIASHFLNYIVPRYPHCRFINLDRLDTVASRKNVNTNVREAPNYTEVIGDCANTDLVKHLLDHYQIQTIVHFAAQTHVDNSFGNSLHFTQDNVLATHNLLECSRNYGQLQLFLHVSTDEVYGEIGRDDPPSHPLSSQLNPTNPYAATKVSAEFLVKSYSISYQLPIIITRCNNVYGSRQYPEKVIPRFILQSRQGIPLTVQGTGETRRRFVHALDVARAYETILLQGQLNQIYQIGTQDEFSVLELAQQIQTRLNPDAPLHIQWVQDRPFNDARYAVDTSELEALGWKQEISFDDGLQETIHWYSSISPDHWGHPIDLTPPALLGQSK